MIKILLFIKHKFHFVWNLIEWFNGFLFGLFFYNRIKKNAIKELSKLNSEIYHYHFLEKDSLSDLETLLKNQNQDQFTFFKPHNFDCNTLKRLYNNKSFLMFGVSDSDKLIGYFFLRCFVNKKCFTGRIVDEKFQGKGIAKRMGKMLHHIAWQSGFRVFGTASKENIKSLKSYQSINNFKIIKELENNYIFFEYLKSEEKSIIE